jgi:ABC-type multidrug transport system ATPase subunit
VVFVTLRIVDLGKRLGGRWVLQRLTETVEGGAAAVIGPNGAGKTTLLRIVAGILEPDEGQIFLRGHPLDRRHIGYVPEAADPPLHLTVAELLALVAALRRAPPLDPALQARIGVDGLAGQRIGSLSLGQRRRACVAAALVGAPWLLVLDEPTNGLDAAGTALLGDLLASHIAGGGCALFATHDLAFADALGARRIVLGTAAGSTRSGPPADGD